MAEVEEGVDMWITRRQGDVGAGLSRGNRDDGGPSSFVWQDVQEVKARDKGKAAGGDTRLTRRPVFSCSPGPTGPSEEQEAQRVGPGIRRMTDRSCDGCDEQDRV